MITDDRTASAEAAIPVDERSERTATGRHADLWRRFTAARHGRRWRTLDQRGLAILTNLVELVTFAEPGDYGRLHDLIRQHGHEQVARGQGRLGQLMGEDALVRAETCLIWRVGDQARTRRRLTAAGVGVDEAEETAASCYSHMFWLLLRDIDQAAPRPVPRTPADLLDSIEHGTIREWRSTLAPVAAAPWSPYSERIAALAEEAGLPVVAESLRECRRVYQLRQEDRERTAIAREVRRRIAVSGATQREFAAYVGTSPSRLSTYATGKVMPSATLLLRIQQASRMLQERLARPAPERGDPLADTSRSA